MNENKNSEGTRKAPGKKPDSGANRILYITVIAVLAVTAAVVGISGALTKRNRNTPVVTTAGTSAVTSAWTTAHTDIQPPVTMPPVTVALTADDQQSPSAGAAAPADVIPVFSLPVAGETVKGYSTDVLVWSLTMEDWRAHTGTDIAAPAGASVYAPADGIIGEIYDDPMMGCCVSVIHSGGAVSVCMNLSQELPEGIESGKEVKAGDVIGYVGESALAELAEESHLHFEILVNGESVGPMSLTAQSASAPAVYED